MDGSSRFVSWPLRNIHLFISCLDVVGFCCFLNKNNYIFTPTPATVVRFAVRPCVDCEQRVPSETEIEALQGCPWKKSRCIFRFASPHSHPSGSKGPAVPLQRYKRQKQERPKGRKFPTIIIRRKKGGKCQHFKMLPQEPRVPNLPASTHSHLSLPNR